MFISLLRKGNCMLIERLRRLVSGALGVAAKCGVVLLLLTALANPALAQGKGKGMNGSTDSDSVGVPEMDPSSIVAAASLLSGSALLLAGRRKRA
jgi:hypothetical protein